MLSKSELQTLVDWPSGAPVLSVYLDVDPTRGSADAYRLELRGLLKPFEESAPQDVQAIDRFIDHEYDWAGRGLIVFSSQGSGFFRSYAVPMPVRTRARRMDSPYLKPLVDLLDSHGHYGVVLVDQQGSRLFHYHLGVLEESALVEGEQVRHTKRGGGSQARGRRGGIAGQTEHAQETADRNIKLAVKRAVEFFNRTGAQRVLVGGTDRVVSKFISQLPKAWASKVVGTFSIEMAAGHDQVLAKALHVAQKAETEKERALVEVVITAAAKGREGVIGLDDTLSAVHAGQVQTLVVNEGYRAPGYQCSDCGFLTAQRIAACPFCGGVPGEIGDAVEMAIRRVIADGGEVEFIHGDSAGELEQAGSIGGVLRY